MTLRLQRKLSLKKGEGVVVAVVAAVVAPTAMEALLVPPQPQPARVLVSCHPFVHSALQAGSPHRTSLAAVVAAIACPLRLQHGECGKTKQDQLVGRVSTPSMRQLHRLTNHKYLLVGARAEKIGGAGGGESNGLAVLSRCVICWLSASTSH
eukprot:COSAG02_NODE_24229_length_694_cov_1.146218_2_plen_152_part_00